MKKLFDAINKGDFDTVKQVIEKNPVLINCIEKGWRKRDEGLCPCLLYTSCHEVKQSHDKQQGEKLPCGGGKEISHRSPKD